MLFFFFNDTATTEIYTLSLHDALPISIILIFDREISVREAFVVMRSRVLGFGGEHEKPGSDPRAVERPIRRVLGGEDRKSTRLNSSHANISYAVFCLKKKKNKNIPVLI